METDDTVPMWRKHVQYLPTDNVRRLRKEQDADVVQNAGRLQLPEKENKRSLPNMSQERQEAEGIETQDAPGRALPQVPLHEVWSTASLIRLSAD